MKSLQCCFTAVEIFIFLTSASQCIHHAWETNKQGHNHWCWSQSLDRQEMTDGQGPKKMSQKNWYPTYMWVQMLGWSGSTLVFLLPYKKQFIVKKKNLIDNVSLTWGQGVSKTRRHLFLWMYLFFIEHIIILNAAWKKKQYLFPRVYNLNYKFITVLEGYRNQLMLWFTEAAGRPAMLLPCWLFPRPKEGKALKFQCPH